MARHLLSLLFCIVASAGMHAQTDAQIDSLTMQMCKTLATNVNLTDSLRVQSTYEQHLPKFFEKFTVNNDAEFEEQFNRIYYRYQKNCNLLTEILARNIKVQGDWKLLTSRPKNTLAKAKCRQVDKIKKFYYIMPEGQKVNVTIDKGLWYEEFEDGTFSKLSFRWTSDCEFDIEFIESNNLSRKNFSSAGDTYHYGLYNSIGKDFLVWINDTTGNATQSFRLRAQK